MRTLGLFLVVLMLVVGCGNGDESSESSQQYRPRTQSTGLVADSAAVDDVVRYMMTNAQTPRNYVAAKIKEHSVVILGEMHRIKHDPLLVQELIPVAYDAGARYLATEFARAEDQQLIDQLLAGSTYNESLAREIVFRQFPHWPYREYVDIFRAAWEFNQTLGEGAPRFHIVGVNCSPDWSHVKSSEDRDNPEVMKKVWGGCGEEDWARVVIDKVRQKGKVLVHCGIHHAFTRFGQPVVDDNGEFVRYVSDRMGQFLYKQLGRNVMTIFLHAPWYGPEGYDDYPHQPVDGVIDAAVERLGERFAPMGFDVGGSPLADIELKNTLYRQGYPHFTLATYCDGYIVQKPFSEYEAVTHIDGFVTESNLQQARANTPNPGYRDFTVDEFNRDSRDELKRHEADWRGL